MLDTILIIALILCVICSAFFSGSENALSECNKLRIKKEAEEGNKAAKRAQNLIENYSKSISTILIGNNLVNIAASSFTTVLALRLFPNIPDAVTYATIIITIIILICGEIVPKILATEHANSISKFISFPLRIFQILFSPLLVVITKLIDKTEHMWTPEEVEDSVTDEELVDIVESIEEEGVIDEDKSELIISAIEFSDIDAYEIMVPRVDVVGINIEDSVDEILKDLSIFNHSVVPVYKESLDDIVGVIKTKDLMRQYLITGSINLEEIMKEPKFVHKTKSILDLLEEFKETGDQMAFIIDEFGGTMGIVTTEDILEELVGDIWDEKDKVEPEFIEKTENILEVDGMMNIFDFFELVEYDSREFESAYTTLGGWCTEMLEDFPEVGEKFSFEYMDFEILEMDDLRVEKVKVTINAKTDDDE